MDNPALDNIISIALHDLEQLGIRLNTGHDGVCLLMTRDVADYMAQCELHEGHLESCIDVIYPINGVMRRRAYGYDIYFVMSDDYGRLGAGPHFIKPAIKRERVNLTEVRDGDLVIWDDEVFRKEDGTLRGTQARVTVDFYSAPENIAQVQARDEMRTGILGTWEADLARRYTDAPEERAEAHEHRVDNIRGRRANVVMVDELAGNGIAANVEAINPFAPVEAETVTVDTPTFRFANGNTIRTIEQDVARGITGIEYAGTTAATAATTNLYNGYFTTTDFHTFNTANEAAVTANNNARTYTTTDFHINWDDVLFRWVTTDDAAAVSEDVPKIKSKRRKDPELKRSKALDDFIDQYAPKN